MGTSCASSIEDTQDTRTIKEKQLVNYGDMSIFGTVSFVNGAVISNRGTFSFSLPSSLFSFPFPEWLILHRECIYKREH